MPRVPFPARCPIEPFVDIHCHLLPGIDDGATDWETTLVMARMAVADGIRTVVVTPHQLGTFGANRGAAIRQLVEQTGQFLTAAGVPLQVLPGADVRVEGDLPALLQSGDILSLADRRRHVLLELPHELYMPLEGLLARLTSIGMTGVLSHPERNQGIVRQPDVVEQLVDAGCLMQVTAGSLTGGFGGAVSRFSAQLVQRGLVHFVATDAHGTTSRRPLLSEAYRRVTELVDEETARTLCCRNPARVARGEQVTAGRLRPRRRGLGGWWSGRQAG